MGECGAGCAVVVTGVGTRDAGRERGGVAMDDEFDIVLDGVEEPLAEYRAVRQFEDLVAWQLARELTASVYRMTRTTPMSRDRGLCEQIQRASVSIMSNIAEGHERGSTQEYYRFLAIAKASCAEVRSLLYVALDSGYITRETFNQQLHLAERAGQVIGGLRSSLARRMKSNGKQ